MQNKKGGFTMVELIVVITILIILAAIGFVSFSGYLGGVRDANRVSQLNSISNGLDIVLVTSGELPLPDSKVEIRSSGSVIGYQGYVGKDLLETINYNKDGVDPKNGDYFSYYITKKRKNYQLLSFLEESNTEIALLNNSFATDYSERFPKVVGQKLGILTDVNNTPIQELSIITLSGFLDIVNTLDIYNANIDNNQIISGTGSDLLVLEALQDNEGGSFTCNDIKNSGIDRGDGIYKIFAGGKTFDVLCDMTNNGGGWTLIDGVSDRFGQIIVPQWGGVPNIDNYSMDTENLYGLLNSNKSNYIFKYKIDREGYTDNLELNIEIKDIKEFLESNGYIDAEIKTNFLSTFWITINGGTEVQPKIKSNYTRSTLRKNDSDNDNFGYGNLKSYSNEGPNSWSLNNDGLLGLLYLNKSLLNVTKSSLPTFGGLFTWNNDQSSLHEDRLYMYPSGESFISKGYEWQNYSSLLNKGLKAGLWVK